MILVPIMLEITISLNFKKLKESPLLKNILSLYKSKENSLIYNLLI